METEFNDVISKLEAVIRDIEVFEKRLKKLDELTERAKVEGKETIGYGLAREEYEDQIKKIVKETTLDIEALGRHEAKFEAEKERLETEKIKKGAMHEVERELNEDATKISELEKGIQSIESEIKSLETSLQRISSAKASLQPYLPKPPSECNHPRKRIVTTLADMRDLGRGIIYECPDCGKRWRE
jgi:DNA-directed RNA polymerase subunit M/transcription elongation factor TFIIS